MKKQYYLFILVIGLVISLACNESDPEPEPDLSLIALSATDYSFNDQGLARVENLDPNDLGNPNATHTNYALTIVTTGLQPVQFGDKTFFEIDPSVQTDEVTAIALNLYAPITQLSSTGATNLLGGEPSRLYNFEDFNATAPSANAYFFLQGALITQSFVDVEDNRNFQFGAGKITLSGTLPDLTVTFDVEVTDVGRNIEGTFTGSITGNFRVEENN